MYNEKLQHKGGFSAASSSSKTLAHGAKQGFFFTVMALAMLSVMLLVVQLWISTYGQSDIRSAERFKGEAMRLVLSSISDKTMSDFANASAFFAAYKLANYSSEHGLTAAPQKYGANNTGVGRVEDTLYSLMYNGTAQPDALFAPITYSPGENSSYTLGSWQDKVRSAANSMGFNASFSGIKNFSIKQDDPWTIATHFEMDMNISDIEGTMKQSKTLKADASFPIGGFLDPAITRSDMAQRGVQRFAAQEKQIFRFPAYSTPSDLKPRVIMNGSKGFGWFFGPITEDYPDEPSGIFQGDNNEQPYISQYVLVTGWDERLPTYAGSYGAVVLTSSPSLISYNYTSGGCTYNVTQETRCLNCIRSVTTNQPGCTATGEEILPENRTSRPYIVRSSGDAFNTPELNLKPRERISTQYALVDNAIDNKENPAPLDIQGDYHRVFDVTALRDATTCGFYVKGNGPSFFQRMLVDAFAPGLYANDALGIETFAVGQWAGGKEDPEPANTYEHDKLPRLDRDFYSGQAFLPQLVMKVKGMPGCRDKAMCSSSNDNATKEGLGRFRLTANSIASYNLSMIACNTSASANQHAPCET